MSDLISRQQAITLPVTPKEYREYQTYNLDDAYEQGWEDLQKQIEQLPSAEPEHPMVDVAKVTMAMAKKADMVAVTRCKDCKYGAEYPEDKEWPWRCSGVWYDGDGGDQYVRPTSYCSFAERRTDE